MTGKSTIKEGASSLRCVFMVGLLVAATLFHVWQKVEKARVAGGIDTAHEQIAALRAERSKLLAAVAIKRNPAYLERIAVEELGMVQPARRLAGALAHWEGN